MTDFGFWISDFGSPANAVAPAFQNQKSKIQGRAAFTLTEILVVIVLIVMIIALAVPAFNAITGTRSVDAAENLVSAMVGLARAEAIRNNRLAGVAFFRDLKTERTAMALVVQAAQRGSASGEPGGLEQYKGWKQYQEDGTTPTRYYPGDVVVALVDMPAPDAPKKGTKLFICTEEHGSTAGTKPPSTPEWGSLSDEEIDTLAGYEYQYLPSGVAAQTINDPDPDPANPMPTAGRDRYLRSGLILFDGTGALVHRRCIIRPPASTDTDPTHLYRLFGFEYRTDLGNPLPPGQSTFVIGNAAAYPYYSQVGIVLYEEQPFTSGGFSQEDPSVDKVPFNAMAPVNYNETNEERWLDNNCLSLMINRYNGTLVRGE